MIDVPVHVFFTMYWFYLLLLLLLCFMQNQHRRSSLVQNRSSVKVIRYNHHCTPLLMIRVPDDDYSSCWTSANCSPMASRLYRITFSWLVRMRMKNDLVIICNLLLPLSRASELLGSNRLCDFHSDCGFTFITQRLERWALCFWNQCESWQCRD